MPTTYEPIATNTLLVDTNTITFSSIPATYTDLRLVILAMASTATIDTWLFINNDTSALYSGTRLSGTGAAASSARFSNVSDNYDTNLVSIGSDACLITHDIFSYAGSTFKTDLTTVAMNRNNPAVVHRYVKLYRSTAAITRLDYRAGGSTLFKTGSMFTLYGIKAA